MPVLLDSAQDAFFRASIRLTCCNPNVAKVVASPVSQDYGVWSALNVMGCRFSSLIAGYVPGLNGVCVTSASVYHWIHNLPLIRAATANQTIASSLWADFL